MLKAYILQCEIAYISGDCADCTTSSSIYLPACHWFLTCIINHDEKHGKSWSSTRYCTATKGWQRQNIILNVSSSSQRSILVAMYSLHNIHCCIIKIVHGQMRNTMDIICNMLCNGPLSKRLSLTTLSPTIPSGWLHVPIHMTQGSGKQKIVDERALERWTRLATRIYSKRDNHERIWVALIVSNVPMMMHCRKQRHAHSYDTHRTSSAFVVNCNKKISSSWLRLRPRPIHDVLFLYTNACPLCKNQACHPFDSFPLCCPLYVHIFT